MIIRTQGFQRQSDGKGCCPLSPQELGVRWACLAIFFLALGLGEICTGDAWNLPSEGTGVGFFSAGQSSRRDQCTGTGSFHLAACVCVYGQTCTYNTPSAPPPPKPFLSSVAVFRVNFWKQLHVDDAWASVRTHEGGHAQSCTRSGAAWRRRQRRLLAHWRHEQFTLQVLLATYQHHAAPRGQKQARSGVWGHEISNGTLRGQSTATRTGEWGREQNYTAKTRDPATPQPELFSLEEEPGGGRPAPLARAVEAAHCGARCRTCRFSMLPCRSWWTVRWISSVLDLPVVFMSFPCGSPGTADGGTVGRRAYPAHCRAAPQASR